VNNRKRGINERITIIKEYGEGIRIRKKRVFRVKINEKER